MYFTKATFILSLAVSALALPITDSEKQRRAATGTSAAVLTKQSYVDFQVSDGVGGNALAEVEAKFPVSRSVRVPPVRRELNRNDHPLTCMRTSD